MTKNPDKTGNRGYLKALALDLTLATAAAASVAAAYSFSWAWPGVLITLALAHGAAERHKSGRAFLLGWLTGTLLYVMGFTWIAHTLRVFGEMSWALSVTGLILFSLAHGLAMGLWVLTVRLLTRRAGLAAWAAFPLAYLPIEHFFPILFPWQLGAPLQAMRAFVQIVDITGAGGLTFFAALVSGALVDLWHAKHDAKHDAKHAPEPTAGPRPKKRPWLGAVVAALVLLGGSIYGLVRLSQFRTMTEKAKKEARTILVGYVQPDVGSYDKEDPTKLEDQVARLIRLSKKATAQGAQLVIWPETALQILLDRSDVEQEASGDHSYEPILPPNMVFRDAAVLAGGLVEQARTDGGTNTYNAALLVTPDGRIAGVTYKVALLLFGERLPLARRFPKLKKWFPHAGDLTPGKEPRVLSWFNVRIGVLICYEDILSDRVRQVAKKQPYFLANLTNDSWFGKSREPSQHLALAALRAIEARRTLIRATNTGKSAFIDPTGRIEKQSRIFQQAVAVMEIPLLTGTTFFVRFGPWLAWLCVALALLALLASLRHSPRNEGPTADENEAKDSDEDEEEEKSE